MKSKTLASANTYLRSTTSIQLVARNVGSSTAIETGKPSQTYVTRYRDARSGKLVDSNNSKHHRKPVS